MFFKQFSSVLKFKFQIKLHTEKCDLPSTSHTAQMRILIAKSQIKHH